MNEKKTPAWRSRPVMMLFVVAITAAAIWLTVRGQDLGQVKDAIAQMAHWPYYISFLCLCIGTLARGLRFHVLMRQANSSFKYAMEMMLIGYLFMTILPLRTGELVRVGYFARRSGSPLLSVTSAAVAERGLDVLVLAFLGAVFLSGAVGQRIEGLPFPPWLLGAVAGAGVVGAVVVGLVVNRKGDKKWLGDGKLTRLLDDLLGGLKALGSLKDLTFSLFLGISLWLLVS